MKSVEWFNGCLVKNGAERPRCITLQGDFISALQISGGPEGCLDAIGNVDFFKDAIQMILYRMRVDTKFIRNIIIGSPHSEQGEYFNLSLG